MTVKQQLYTAAFVVTLLPGVIFAVEPQSPAGEKNIGRQVQTAGVFDTQYLPLHKFIEDYKRSKAAFDKRMADFNEKQKKAADEWKKNNPGKPMPRNTRNWRPSAPQNSVIYPEAEARARKIYEEEAATYEERLAKFNAAQTEYKTVTYPAYEKAVKECDAAMAKNREERKKDPKIPVLKLNRPPRPKGPAGVPRPAVRPKPVETDEICVTVNRNSLPLSVRFKSAGQYKLYIRYYQTEDRYSDIQLRVMAPNSETVKFQRIDWSMYDQNTKPYEAKTIKRPGGFVWTTVDLGVEYPGVYKIILERAKGCSLPKGVLGSMFAISQMWVSNDPDFNPEKASKENSAPVSLKDESAVQTVMNVPSGYQPARHVKPHASLNTVIKDTLKILPTGFHECYPYYSDTIYTIALGATSDPISSFDGKRLGMVYQGDPGGGEGGLSSKYPMPKADPKNPDAKLPDPVGRVADSNGVYGKAFSDNFPEYLENYARSADNTARWMLQNGGDPYMTMMWTAWEQCGNYDYGATAVAAFHKYLEKNYGTLDALNKAWHTEYKSFSEIFPAKHSDIVGSEKIADPLKRCQATANFIDFRDFCSKSYAEKIGLKTKAVLKYDTMKRHITSNLSCNNLSSVMWLKWRPLSFEDTAQITMKGSDMIGYDMYGSDDLAGANFDLYCALGDEKLLPMVREGSIHAPGAQLASRMQWLHFAKGMRGMRTFCLQESGKGELQKFGLSDMMDDGAPRPKLGAYSDNYRALHHLDYLLSETTRQRAVKPVAIYYSSICNVLQEKPYASIFDCGPDNFFRVYQLIRANGYPVTFITDRQIRETDRLDKIQGIFFIDASYIPTDVVDKVEKWVENGGNIIADAQVGQFDGHGFPSKRMAQFLGIKPQEQKRVSKDAAEKLAFGYSAYAFDVINRDELYKTASEYKNQLASTHPIAKKLGKIMVSAMGFQSIRCFSGEVLISNNNGGPAWLIDRKGKGTVSYFAGYLGTMYGAGCTQIEWRDEHSDDSPYRMIDAYLEYIGMKKEAVTDLTPGEERSMRLESPLVDPKGNAVMGMVSYNNHMLPDFSVRYLLPQTAKEPKQVLAVTNGNRTVTPLKFKYNAKDHSLTFRMIGFDVHGTVLSIADSEPMVSVKYNSDAKRDAYNLLDFRPGDEVTATVKVYNLSNDAMKAGQVTLRLPDGWFYDKETVDVPEIAAHGESAEYTFKIKAPVANMSRRLRPLNFIYTSGDRTSSPAVDMVWFQKEPLNAPKPVFDL